MLLHDKRYHVTIAIGYVGFVGFNLTFEKPDTFILLNHTVIMALAFRIIVNKKEAVPIASKSCL